MHKLARLDHQYVWHPFTQMREWLCREPIVITSGRGAVLRDVHGREYLDANSSIWTNLHGHAHPEINAAIHRQLGKIAHSSALGFANEPASLLAERLVNAAKLPPISKTPGHSVSLPSFNPKSKIRNPKLARVFFSDDGSTALEVAVPVPNFCRSKARITATPSAPSASVTLTSSTRPMRGCFSRPIASWRRIVIAVPSTAPGPSAPTPAIIASATMNASASWKKNSPPPNAREIHTAPSWLNLSCRARRG
jgi:hypothetical protein